MGDLVVKRTLVKSPPELWTEVSEVERLARHIGELGNIRISRLEPESAVAWEGDLASGTVEIEASGWGTRVILTAEVDEEVAAPAAEPEVAETEGDAPAEPESSAEPEVQAPAEPEAPASVDPQPSAEPAPQATTATAPDEPEQRPGGPWAPAEESSPEPVVTQSAPKRRGFFARWLFRDRRAAPEPPAAATPPASAPVVAEAACESGHIGAERMQPRPEPEEPRPAPATPAGALAAPEPERAPEPEPTPEPEPVPDPEPAKAEGDASDPDPERVRAVFEAALDSLGSAHHRPFSRG